MNIYNILAELCSYIIKSCDSSFFIKYSCISKKEKNRIEQTLKKYIPRMFSGEQLRVLKQNDIDEALLRTIVEAEERFKECQDYNMILGLIQIIDEEMSEILQEEIRNFQTDDFSVVLNTNRETTEIGLLPRCTCVWERKHRLSQCYNRLDNFLYHFLMMENKILEELIDKHIFLKDNFFPEFRNTHEIKIAATPLKNTKDFQECIVDEQGINYINIEYQDENNIRDNQVVWNKILEAARNHADIIVFPEMLGNSEMESFISGQLKALEEEKRINIPSLIVLPSYWHNRQNVVSILDNHGEIVCRQGKQNPFRAEDVEFGYLENIIPSYVVHILHCEGIGRIGILICKDFLTTHYLEQLIRCFKLTLVIVPSYSTGSYDFQQSFEICAHDDCNVVWLNTCAAMKKGKESNFKNIGFVRKRISKNEDETQKLSAMKSCSQAYRGVPCDGHCMFCETISGV